MSEFSINIIAIAFITLFTSIFGISNNLTNSQTENQIEQETAIILQQEEEETKEIIFSTSFIKVLGRSQDSTFDVLTLSDDIKYKNIQKNDDGTISLLMESSECDAIQNEAITGFNAIKKEFEEYDDSYKIETNNDFSELNMYCNEKTLSTYAQNTYLYYLIITSMEYQTFSGIEHQYVEYNVYNSDTGELVASGNTDDLDSLWYLPTHPDAYEKH